MEGKIMKRMILGTMMCVLMATVAVAQQQDTIARRDMSHERMHPRQEMRAEFRGERKGELRRADADFKKREKLTPEQHAEAKAKFLAEELTLTAKQTDKLQKVFLKEAQTFEKSKTELEGKDEEAKKEQFKKLKANTDKQVKKILTEEEYAKYLQMQQCPKGEGKCDKGNFVGKPEGKPHHKPHELPEGHPRHPQNRPPAETATEPAE
mgnify:CR=1 FL=1